MFGYLSRRESGDSITDFKAAGESDRFALQASAFGNHAIGGLLAGEFQLSNLGTATRPGVRLVYDSNDHSLYFDPDGSGAQAAVLIADLQPGALVVAADITFF